MAKTKHIVIDARIRRSSTGRYVDRLLEHLQEIDNDHRYTVLLEPGDDWQPSNRKFTAIICKYRRFSFNPIQQITFSRWLNKLDADLVHFTLTGHQPLFYLRPQVTTTHDLTMLNYTRAGRLPKWLHYLRLRAYRLLMWVSHHQAKQVIVPTEYVKDAVHKYHLQTGRKITVTYEASEPPLKGKAERPDYAPDKFIMHVGSAFPHKNLERLIDVFGIVRGNVPGLKLLLIGKKEYHAKQLIKYAQKTAYAEDIIFTGFVPDAELKWLYENAAAYVFPSLSEGFGLPGLEAMAHGCPLISSNATCLPEVYGEAAIYFDPNNTEEMTEVITTVLRSRVTQEQLVAKGYEQIKKYSWKKMAQETLEVYKSALY